MKNMTNTNLEEAKRCDGPLKQIGLSDKGTPIMYCVTCKKEVYGYNHIKEEDR
jgi:hypothetical protein